MISSIKNSKDQRTPTNLKTKMKRYPLFNHEEITRTKALTSLPMVHYLKNAAPAFLSLQRHHIAKQNLSKFTATISTKVSFPEMLSINHMAHLTH